MTTEKITRQNSLTNEEKSSRAALRRPTVWTRPNTALGNSESCCGKSQPPAPLRPERVYDYCPWGRQLGVHYGQSQMCAVECPEEILEACQAKHEELKPEAPRPLKINDELSACLDAAEPLYTVSIPQAIVDKYLPLLSRTAWALFTYLARRANFSLDNKMYGKCLVTHKQISDATGIAECKMHKYKKELLNLGLIEIEAHTIYELTRKKTRQGKTVRIPEHRTHHSYTVMYFLHESVKAKFQNKLLKD